MERPGVARLFLRLFLRLEGDHSEKRRRWLRACVRVRVCVPLSTRVYELSSSCCAFKPKSARTRITRRVAQVCVCVCM